MKKRNSAVDEFLKAGVHVEAVSGPAKKLFAEFGAMRTSKAREALALFSGLPDKVKVALFRAARVEVRELHELTPGQRVRLLIAAEDMLSLLQGKADQARDAVNAIAVVVAFKGDRGRE